jgi:outer membrane protein
MKRLILSLISLVCTSTFAQEALPRLEVGATLLAINAPDYRGSKQTNTYVAPLPYFIYRGDWLKIDGGASGVLFNSDKIRLTISGNLSFPANSNTPEREGMDELEATFELGPSLSYRFYDLPESSWSLDLPLRFAYTLDSELDDIGQVFQPRLIWRKPAKHLGDWSMRFNFGPLYSSEAYHNYYYSVAAEDALPTRPAYEAGGGFSGIRVEYSYSRRFGKFWIGGFIRYDDLNNSVIDDSPLVTEPDSWVSGIGLAWIFHQK